jgi:hypothetical protein
MIGGANIGGHDERYRATLGDRPYPTEWMGGGGRSFPCVLHIISYHIIYNCRGYLQNAAQSIFHLFNGGVYGHDPGRSIGLGWQQNWFRFEKLDRGKKEPRNLSFLSNYRYGSWTRAAPSERPTMTTTLFHS